ncbi:MAG TPA: ribbon-helix-helix protein, CopG family [Candidatus Binatia bacterium]|nr:ribbon-helix-helix protein, CopG family [Candidatus Binatia bacterium]
MTRRTHVTLTDEMHEALTRLAKEQGRPVAHLIRESIADLLQRDGVALDDVHPEWGGPRSNGGDAQNE